MIDAAFIFPDQLFIKSPVLDINRKIYIIEDPIFFYGADFNLKIHKKKIFFHKASVDIFYSLLKNRGYDAELIDHKKCLKKDYLHEIIKSNNIKKIFVAEVNSLELEHKLTDLTKKFSLKLQFLTTPAFILKKDNTINLLGENTHYSLSSFYIKTRKNLDILIANGRPYKGKWSFDSYNRKKLPAGLKIPSISSLASNKKYIKIHEKQINIDFSRSYGDLSGFVFPINHTDSLKWFRDFLINRFKYFGRYQDSISKVNPFLFHSLISSLLNTGLLVPMDVISETLDFSREYNIPINSLEGFIRQIIGWREFVRGIYLLKGKYQKKSNYLGNFRKLNDKFYKGATSIIPVDNTINKTIQYSYAHHIERLMIMGNFMLLCEIEPKEVYKWFMELFIDAFDWVMIPNVFGMSQYADGGLMSSKPYFSSSNYIIKMSDYKKENWCSIWDSLYWRFLYKKRDFIKDNPRMKLTLYNLDKMGKNKIKDYINISEAFLEKLF